MNSQEAAKVIGDIAHGWNALIDRVENLESGRDRPPSALRTASRYRTYRTPLGPVYDLPNDVKMADIAALRPERLPEISFPRWLHATVAGDKCPDREAVEYARSLQQKQLVSTTSGILIPQVYQPEWYDLLRAQSVLVKAGMRTVTMGGKIMNASAVTADPTVGWHSEAGAISAANPTFAARTLTAQTVVARCQGSLELAQDSPDFGSQLSAVMAKALAGEIDRVGLEGTGTPPQPRGIKNTSGRSSVTNIGTLADYSKFVSGVGALLAKNVPLDAATRAIVMSPGCWTALENLVTGISGDKRQLPRPQCLANTQFLVTSNVAGNIIASPQVKTTAYLGDFADITMGVRMEAAIEVVKAAAYTDSLVYDFIGVARCDFVVTRPASFCTLEGILA